MLERGMIESENHFLRETMCKRIKDIMFQLFVSGSSQQEPNSFGFCFATMLEILIGKLVETSKLPQYEGRSNHFYQQLCVLLSLLREKELKALQPQLVALIG